MENMGKAARIADQSPASSSEGLRLWGGVFGMVLARQLATRRSLASGSIVRLDEFRQKLGGIGAGLDSLEQL